MALLCEGEPAHLQISDQAGGPGGPALLLFVANTALFQTSSHGGRWQRAEEIPTLKEELQAGSAWHRGLVGGGWTVRLAY